MGTHPPLVPVMCTHNPLSEEGKDDAVRLGLDLGQVATHIPLESLLTMQVRPSPEPDPQAPGISPGSRLISVPAWLL